MNSPYALQAFTQAIHEAAFWNHGTLVAIHALCLADPIQVLYKIMRNDKCLFIVGVFLLKH